MAGGEMAEAIEIFCGPRESLLLPVEKPLLAAALEAMLRRGGKLGKPLRGIELRLVDDREIARVNRENLGINGPTNIISFPPSKNMRGILVLSLDAWRRECILYGQDGLEHLTRLLAHGLGHLSGYDHGPEMDRFCHFCEMAAMNEIRVFQTQGGE